MPYKKPLIWEVRLRPGARLDAAGNARADGPPAAHPHELPGGLRRLLRKRLGRANPPQAHIASDIAANHDPFECVGKPFRSICHRRPPSGCGREP